MDRYEIIIYWSRDDDAFVADVPELPGCVAHGDSHYFRLDKPYTAPILPKGKGRVENITRVESFGAQDVHWVEVFVNPRDANVFRPP